jgi:hypothetical protein
VADAAALKQMCIDDNCREYEFGVPPPLVRKDLIEQMRAEADALLPPQYLDCVRHIDQPFFTPVYDFCSARLVYGRVALVENSDRGKTLVISKLISLSVSLVSC